MGLEFLRRIKCPELAVIERDLISLYPELKWITGHDLIESKFEHKWKDIEDKKVRSEKEKEHNPIYIDRTENGLKNNTFTVPVLVSDTLIPLLFQRRIGGKIVNYNSYSTYINYDVVYSKGNAVKIDVVFGRQVLKKSEEMHMEAIPLSTTSYHFVYDNDKKQWLEVAKEKFSKASESIEVAIKSDEVIEVIKNYISHQDNVESKLNTFVEDKNFNESIKYLDNLVSIIKEYHLLQNILCTIKDEHLVSINNQIEKFEKKLETYKESIFNTTLHEYKKLENLSVIRNSILMLLKTESGYFVKHGNAYPNIAELYKLTQKASSSRTAKGTEQLHKSLLSFFEEKKESYIDINDPRFINYFKRHLV